ncbi:MAG: DUF2812 domain-containing protein [Lachnospiraceae bacterium]|nr:DUF2812 domain-containing protein [Lachnospiraceae bacterium]
MSGTSEEKKTIYRLAPCPAYDVEGLESWLEDMAEEGLFLTEDGFFCGFGFFYREEPQKVKYRLQASESQGGFFSDDYEPLKEEQELSEALGWEYVTRHGEFYIYRSMGENMRELNTDPEVQAITMKMVQKRQYNSLFNCVLWMILYPLLKKNGAVILPMLYMKSWFFFFSVILILCFFLGSARKLAHYTCLRKKLKKGEQLNREKNWKKKAWLYPAKNVLIIVLCCTWGCLVLANFHRTVLFEDEIPLEEYHGNPPFATMADIAPGSFYEIQPMHYVNTVTEWSDVLAPVNVIWEEYAEIQVSEDRTVSGLWDINYHEVKWEWMAKLLAKDYYRLDQERDFEFIGELDLGIDYAVAYLDEIHMPRVVLRHGTKVLHGSFHEYSHEQENYFSLEEWAAILAESLKE